jgi:hypothetical protein
MQPRAYVAVINNKIWWEGSTPPAVSLEPEPKNRFQGTNSAKLCSLAGWYDNPFPIQFLAPIEACEWELGGGR